MAEKPETKQEIFSVDQRRWRDVGAGLCALDLHETNGRRLQLVRLGPAGRILAHQHAGTEVMYLICGSMVVDGVRLRAGDVLKSATGTIHRESVAGAEGCELVIECSPDDQLLRS